MKATTKRVLGIVVAIALVSALAAAPAAAQDDHEEFLVELNAEGDADVTMTYAFDLETNEERAAFEELQENATAQDASVEQFENRMHAVAADAGEASDREMAVTDVEIAFESADDVGVVILTFHWERLAAVEDDRLTVTEPFASGFSPDRTFTVAAPDGYEITSATPDPSASGEASASWEAGTNLQGFELVAERDDDAADDTDGDGAGFGVAAAVSALLAAALLAARRP